MGISEIAQNLSIGIISGIFSSIIVSVIFYLLTNIQQEISDAEKIIEPLKMASVAWNYKDLLTDGLDVNKEIIYFWKKSLKECRNIQIQKFDNELENLLFEIRDISLSSEYVELICQEKFEGYIEMVSEKIALFERYKHRVPVVLMKRFFRNKIILITIFASLTIFILA